MASANEPPQARIVAVAEPIHFKRDAWLFADLILIRSLLPFSPSGVFLSYYDLSLPHRAGYLKLHGSPLGERVVLMDNHLQDFSWIEIDGPDQETIETHVSRRIKE